MILTLAVGAIFILLILSSIFSASETAVIASSKAKLHAMVKEGDKRAKVLVHLRRHMGRLVSSLLIGGTLINITASTLSTWVLVNLFGDAGVLMATLLMGVLIVFFGEVMPKIIAINFPEIVAKCFYRVLRIVSWLFAPLAKLSDLMARGLLGIFGVKIHGFSSAHTTSEELRGLIEMHIGPGEDIAQQRAMLRSILDLAIVDVGEVMTHRKNVFMLDISDGPEKVIEAMRSCPYTRVPLWRDNPDNVIGVLHAKELFRILQDTDKSVEDINLYEIVSKPWFIPETADLLDQLQQFRKRREHFSIVVDEYGAMMGILTLEDILEEIVGEIVDEHDDEIPGVRTSSDGSVVVMGSVTIRDLNRQFEWDLPDEEAATVAGLVMHMGRVIPEVGQRILIKGFTFEVLRRQRNQITLIRIVPNGGSADTELEPKSDQ
ncbi:MAG: HlyC/CorC family transporter [Alphaproteobacteria bacterium]